MAIYNFTYDDPGKNLPIYRFGKDLGAVFALDQDTLIPVLAEALGTGDGTTTIFPLDNNFVREGSVHVFIDAVEVFNFTVDFFAGRIIFDTAPPSGAITADYNYEGDIMASYDVTLPMTISGDSLFEFNRVNGDIAVVRAMNPFFNASATTSGAGDNFSFVITVTAV